MSTHHHDHPHESGASDLKIGLMGLGIGLVWITIVAVIAHWLAL